MSARPRADAAHERLIRKLRTIADLSDDAVRVLAGLPVRMKDFTEGSDVFSEGDRPSETCVIVEGWTCRYKLLDRGQRQIFSFHIPGDMPDLQSLHVRTMDHSMCALTPLRVAFISHSALDEAMREHPAVQTALWRDTLIDAAVFREWMAGIGRRSAYQRIGHLFCELYLRMRVVGLTADGGFPLYITQAEIADALGLTPVHVNRVLKSLRGDRLISTEGRYVSILNWEGLQSAADFDPTYLHLRTPNADEGPP
jgi:CRP-like cAMP-binding protein